MDKGELIRELRAMRTIMGWMATYQVAMAELLESRGIITDKEISGLMNQRLDENAAVITLLLGEAMGRGES